MVACRRLVVGSRVRGCVHIELILHHRSKICPCSASYQEWIGCLLGGRKLVGNEGGDGALFGVQKPVVYAVWVKTDVVSALHTH